MAKDKSNGGDGQVTLRGRFPVGSDVTLVEADGPWTLRAPEGAEPVDTQTVDEDGSVQFTGLEPGGRYFATGLVDGFPLSVRLTARAADADEGLLVQPPVGPERVRLGIGGTGGFADEKPQPADEVAFEGAPHAAQSHADEGEPQRSATLRGSAHPVDPEEQTPLPRQEDIEEDALQMSDTETGSAAPAMVGPQRQEDVGNDVWQRSSTPTGVSTLMPEGGPIAAQREKESSEAKARRGTPQKAAAMPLYADEPITGASGEDSANRQVALAKSEKQAAAMATPGPALEQELSGHDAQGQPADPQVAAAAGIEPAEKPVEDKPKKEGEDKPRASRARAREEKGK